MSTPGRPLATHPPGVVLAGGLSSRMGRDKSAVILGGKSLLEHVIARLQPQTSGIGVNSNTISSPDLALGIPVFADTVSGHVGPMAGVLSAMRFASTHFPQASHVATVPIDTPFFPLGLVSRLQSVTQRPDQITVAASAGVLHPVFALWPVLLAEELEHWLKTDEKRRVRSFIERQSAKIVDFPVSGGPDLSIDPFFNINTAADLEMAGRWLPLVETPKP